MNESMIRTFIRDTYQSRSPVPFIISIQVAVFVLIHLLELLHEVNIISGRWDIRLKDELSLPLDLDKFLAQPWSLLTYSFVHVNLFRLLFNCLFLFGIGRVFFTFLNRRQFLFVYSIATLAGGLLFIALGTTGIFYRDYEQAFYGSAFALAAIVAVAGMLSPRMPIRLLLLGDVQLWIIAAAYVFVGPLLMALDNKAGAISMIAAAFLGLWYLSALQKGSDWSLIFGGGKSKTKLKVVHKNFGNKKEKPFEEEEEEEKTTFIQDDDDDFFANLFKPDPLLRPKPKDPNSPDQEAVDAILDKISLSGYDSLTAKEKELLFKASKRKD